MYTLPLSPRHYSWIIFTLLGLSPIIGMAVDLIAPSLPAMAHDLHVSAGTTKNIITLYLIGYALGNFISGFLSDAYGRRNLLRLSLLGFVLVSFIPIALPNIGAVLSARCLQGLMLGSCAVLTRAIYADIIPVEKLVRMGTLLGTLWGLGPILGPVMGGYLQFYFGWQACFYFFAIVASLLLIMVFLIVPETHRHRHPLRLNVIQKDMCEVLKHQSFMATVLLMGLVYSLIIAFHTAGPFLIQVTLHHNAVYFGRMALWMGVMFLAATTLSRRLIDHFTLDAIYRTVIWLFFYGALILVGLSYVFAQSILFIAIASGAMFAMAGLIFPMSIGKGMSLFRHIAGTATATMYLINTLITSLVAFLMSFINLHSTMSLIGIYFCLISLMLLVYICMLRGKPGTRGG